MASLDVIRRITLRAEAEGFEDAARKLQSLGRAEEDIVASSERTERASGRVEQSFRRIEATLDPAARALQQYERTQRTVQAAQAQGVTTQSRANELLSAAEDRVLSAARGTQALAEAHKGLSAQSQAALHSIRSVAEQIVLGVSPVQALTGQMNHLSFAATGEGGLTGAFAGLRPVVSGLLGALTPARVAIGGTATALLGGVFAANEYAKSQAQIDVSLKGLGRSAGTTAEQVRAVAVASADAGHVTVGAAKDMAAEYLRAGNIGTTALGELIAVTRDYATTTGQAVPAATKELAAALSDPLTGLDKLDAKLNFVDAAQRRNILTLAASGKIYQAQQAIIDALPPSMAKYSDSVSVVGKVWDFAAEKASKFFELTGRTVSNFVSAPTPEQALQRAGEIRTAIQPTSFAGAPEPAHPVAPAGFIGPAEMAKAAAAAEDQARFALAQMDRARKALDTQQVDEWAKSLSKGADVITRQVVPGMDEMQKLQSATATLGQSVALGQGGPEAVLGLKRYEAALEDYTKAGGAAGIEEAKLRAQHEATLASIKALGGAETAAAAAQAVRAQQVGALIAPEDRLTAQTRARTIETEKQNVAERNRTLQHNANMAAITAVTQAEAEAAVGQQAYTAALIGGATAAQASKAASQAMAEEQAKDAAAAHQIGRAHEANMLAIVALTTEEKANAAASVAAAGQREGSMAAAAAATAAYAEELAKAAVAQRDFDRQLAASQGNAMREATAQLQAAQLPIGPGRQREAGQIQATAAAQSQIATIQAQNPNIKIDTSAFVQAAQDVAALSESARQASTSLQLIQQWGQQATQLNISTDVLNGSISKADGAYRQVITSGMEQVNALGLEGDARDKATAAIDRAGRAAYNNAIAQGQSQQRAAEAADLASRNVEALARDAQMASQGITSMGVALKNIVHDTTISAQDAAGKTLGAGVTLTGILTQEGYWRAKLAEDATKQLEVLNSSTANDNLLQSQKGLQSQAMAVASPLSSLVEQAQSTLDSARDEVKSAQQSAADAAKNAQAQPMANATQADPRLDPYLSRNASVYYGTATEQFYKEISWQEASLSTAKESASIDQEALQTAQQHLSVAEQQYNTLQSLADSANRMAASGMTPEALGASLANSLKAAGFGKTAADVAAAGDSYGDAKRSLDVQMQKAELENTIAYAKNLAIPPIPHFTGSTFNTATPFTPLQDVALKPHATGADLILPGSGGEQPYMVSAQPGERLRISPRDDSGGAYQDNRTITTHVYGVTQPEAVAARLEQDEKNRRGYSSAAVRAARLAA